MGSRLLGLSLLVGAVSAGHNDMFSCRGKKGCPVTELTDSNWDLELMTPTFVMFYAPWCGHCKQLAPTLKKAAKALEGSGVKIGAIDVEPNPKTQAKFPDIRGFPTLKFCPSSNAKKALDYNGGRDDASIVSFAKEQAKKAGVVPVEPVVAKQLSELYTFFGRAALDKKPPLLLVGSAPEAPAWVGKLATELRQPATEGEGKGKKKESPEAKTKELLQEAARATEVSEVKEGIASLLEALASSEVKQGLKLGPSVVTPAYTADPSVVGLFGFADADLPALVLAAVDRKTATGSYVSFPGVKDAKKGKGPALEPLASFVREHLRFAAEGPSALSAHAPSTATALPAFPKPPNVVAAEEREKKRKAKEGGIAPVASQGQLETHCYGLAGKTCALLALPGGAAAASADEDAGLAALAKRFSKEGFAFVAVDTSEHAGLEDAFLAPLFGDSNEKGVDSFKWPALALVKGGKRPRVAVSAGGGAEAMAAMLDAVVGGGGSFSKLKGGLPAWPAGSNGDSAGGEEEDGVIRDDEL